MEFELEILGIPFVSGYRCEAFYKGVLSLLINIGDPYYVDWVVQYINKREEIVVELKVCRQIEQSHLAFLFHALSE